MQQFTRKPRRGEESVSLVVGSRQPRRRILVLCEQAKSWGKTQFKDCIFKTNKQTKLTLKTTEFFMQYRKRLLLCRSHWCCSKCTLPSHWKIFVRKIFLAKKGGEMILVLSQCLSHGPRDLATIYIHSNCQNHYLKKSCHKVSICLGAELKRYLAEFRLNSKFAGGFPYLGWSMHIQKSGSSDSTQLRACKTLKGWFRCLSNVQKI